MKQPISSRRALGTRNSVAAALVLSGLATLGLPTPADAAPQNFYGLIRLTPGTQTGTKPATGTFFRMQKPDGTYVANTDSRAVDKTYTILKPGTDGGLLLSEYQSLAEPAFSSTGDGLSSRIIAPEKFLGSKLALSTNQVDPQTGYAVGTPAIAVDGDQVIGNFNSFDLTWNNQHFNQGAPKPIGQQQGLTQDVSGTYNASTKTFAITWRSKIIGGAFNNYTGEWHLTGKFTSQPVLTSNQILPAGLAGKPYATTLKASDGKPGYTWSVAPGTSLPAGLTLSTAGRISGTPVGPVDKYFGVLLADSTGPKKLVTNRGLYLKIEPMTVNDQGLPQGLVGKAYPTTKLTAVGGKAALTWTVSEGVLPPGLTLSTNGSVSGTPTAGGLKRFTVKVADASTPKNTATRTFEVGVAPMTITTATLPAAVVGKAITTTKLTTNGGKGTLVWTVDEGSLPPGLKLSTAGALSGTPTTADTYAFTVQVADAGTPRAIAKRTYIYTVSPAG